VEAINSYGSATATLVILVKDGHITSATSADGIVGVPFLYQITADNNPNRYTASALPAGLHLDRTLGMISGTPAGAGTFQVDLQASNDDGSASATIVITINEGAITSAVGADGVVGVPFSYQIAADNNPNRYSASSLPPGLHFDGTFGLISGTPTVAGTFPVNVEARNNYGSASATVVITINEGAIGGGTVSQPALAISRSGDSFLVSWPAASDGFVLEEAELKQGTWSNSSVAISVQGSENVASIPIQSTVKFYRLRKSSQ
jgi:hypothetical protein